MSAGTSETDNAVCTMQKGSGYLEADFAAMNINSGSGIQSNYLQAGIRNTQYNAQTQTFYNTTQPSSEEEKIVNCQNSLLTIRPENHRAAIAGAKGQRVAGTWEWIWKNAVSQSLLRGEIHLLWIQGGPGKGKTILSIFLTQELERVGKIIYFFCQADDEARRSATYLLRSLIWQLTIQQPATAQHLRHYLYPPDEKQFVLTSREDLWSILLEIVNDLQFTRSFCLLDGLDECDDESQRWLATKFTDLCNSHEKTHHMSLLRVIIVSRPGIPALRTSKRIVLDPDNRNEISHNIEVFVESRVRELSDQLEGLPNNTRTIFEADMRKELLLRAGGTFLWVGFAMIELLKKLKTSILGDTTACSTSTCPHCTWHVGSGSAHGWPSFSERSWAFCHGRGRISHTA